MKKLLIILVLVFSCGVAWGDNICCFCRIEIDSGEACDTCQKMVGLGVLRPVTEVYKLQKEIELLKGRIEELEMSVLQAANVIEVYEKQRLKIVEKLEGMLEK